MEPVAKSSVWRWKKKHSLLAVVLLSLIVVLLVTARQAGLMRAVDGVIAGLRDAGPAVFFVAMALLPAVGFPMLAFTLAAGPVFGPVLGPGWVIGWSLAAVVANLLLTYWLTNHALRPLVVRLLDFFEIRQPVGRADGAWQTTLIVRLTPGPPFWVQSYLLGVLRVPLAPYLVVSILVMSGYVVALVCGGDAIVEGNGQMAFAAAGLLVVLVAVLQLLRKRTARRRAVAAAPVPAVLETASAK
jgi:uncharacterized membrane protein YdjX (TVP38/TMEM64 family)